MTSFPESDWKMLSKLQPVALERLCQRILEQSAAICGQAKEGARHEAYLRLFQHVKVSDKVVARCFDHWSRSNAIILLINWRSEKLISAAEIQNFSQDTQARVGVFLS